MREQQTQLTQELIVKAFVEELESNPSGSFSMAEIADKAGVSVRTVYRHFADRAALLGAAAGWITKNRFGPIPLPQSADDLPRIFQEASSRFAEHPAIVRAVAFSEVGHQVGAAPRGERHKAMSAALHDITAGLDEAERRRVEAVFAVLYSMAAWVIMHEDFGLSAEEAGAAGAWAMTTLTESLRRD
ncbi:MAG: TetR/AcrR family transcriptional regulator [Actinobacteria bacterium]|nr:TetR/AcrR family transcriptional regulator [Actinomycetota bacterium]